MANLVLAHAAEAAKTRTTAGPPVVTRDDILKSARVLVQILQNAEHWVEEKEDDAETSKNVLAALGKMREAIEALSANAGPANK
jgi:hypothetical protein